MHKQDKKFNQEIKSINSKQTEILQLTNTMTSLKNSVESFNIRLGQAEEIISELQGKAFEIIQLEEKKMKKSENSLWEPQDTIKRVILALWESQKKKR